MTKQEMIKEIRRKFGYAPDGLISLKHRELLDLANAARYQGFDAYFVMLNEKHPRLAEEAWMRSGKTTKDWQKLVVDK